MRKLKLYLETSVWNFYFADDAPEERDVTKSFFDFVKKGAYEIYHSDVVLFEVNKASESKRKELLGLIDKCASVELGTTPEAEDLASKYISRKIVPASKREDALHVGVATVAEVDALITWNYQHLIGLRRSEIFHAVNLESGYLKKIEIISPREVETDES